MRSSNVGFPPMVYKKIYSYIKKKKGYLDFLVNKKFFTNIYFCNLLSTVY